MLPRRTERRKGRVFPGCNRSARLCHIDHTKDWLYDGETNADNLAHLCRSHHHLKHASSGKPKHLGEAGTLEWTSALGRTHRTHPEVGMPGGPVAQQEWLKEEPPPF